MIESNPCFSKPHQLLVGTWQASIDAGGPGKVVMVASEMDVVVSAREWAGPMQRSGEMRLYF